MQWWRRAKRVSRSDLASFLHLNRLPPPSFPLLDHRTQARERWKMMPHHQGLLDRSPVQDSPLATGGQVGHDIIDRQPIGVFEVQGVEYCVANAQKQRLSGRNLDCYMARCVPWCRDGTEPRYNSYVLSWLLFVMKKSFPVPVPDVREPRFRPIGG